ncbi:MAG: VWA domain-containing protein [Solirubrobacteraceae bacterium]|nr:VWA domain-containing protein [Solirubrobacteraceae bacterium]
MAAAALGHALRAAGLPVTPQRSATFARAVALLGAGVRSRLYWAARLSFVSSRAQVDDFDRVFAAVVDGTADPAQAQRGDPVARPRRRRRLRPRPLVALLDVSGSMAPFARAYLLLLEGAALGARAETFVFATGLTRVTRALRDGRAAAALARASAAAPDWADGTHIGGALRAFTDGHGRRGLTRDAVVVILSDGWERGDPALLGREMARLARLAYRVVWVNPRAAAPGFAPVTGGMAAALPHVDELVSGHSVAALDAVVAAIGRTR